MNPTQPTSPGSRPSPPLPPGSQQAAVRRPVWLHAMFALAAGSAVGIASLGSWPMIAIGLGILVLVGGAVAVLERRTARRRTIVDDRAVGARAAVFFPMSLVVFVAANLHPGDDWQPWFALAAGVAAAVAGFAYLRLDDRYQARRLASGDYGRYDLL